ncbi:hypothetical protein HYY72_02875 [Candidatus Woesearchaeota archaeon]|nr:hypothetical protein [Candidatus Woesearchaeota archaeon]
MLSKETLKKEAISLGLAYIALLIIFQAVFYRENVLVTLRSVSSLFWLFILPGFIIMLYWHESLDFLQRLIIGSALGAAIVGLLGYNLGLLGIHIMYHGIILPLAMYAVGAIMILKKGRN